MRGFLNDLRHGLRSLRGCPGFSLTAILTLMLGIGMVAAIFTVYDAVLLKPLPFAQSERIVRLVRDQPPVSGPISAPALREWQEKSTSAFDAFGAFVTQTFNLTGGDAAERVQGYAVTPGFWNVLSQPLALGRAFGEEEERTNQHVVVLSDALWRNRYGADPAIVGRDIDLNGERWRVIGVTAPGMTYPDDARLWVPTFLPASGGERGSNSLSVLARLAPGVSLAQASEVMRGITAWQAQTFPDQHEGLSAQVRSLHEVAYGNLRSPLTILLGAAALVLLIACANLASLMLTRAQTREQELALRRALGADRASLTRSVLAEALLITAIGTLAALALARIAVPALLALAPDLLPTYHVPGVDARIVIVSAGVAITTLLLFGVLPAWRASNADPAQALRSGARGQVGNRAHARARSVLVAFELAIALTLITGAGLLIGSLRQITMVDSGMGDVSQVLTARFTVPQPSQQPGEDSLAWLARVNQTSKPMIDTLQERLAAIPGVRSVYLGNQLPASGDWTWNGGLEIRGHEVPENSVVQFRFISPGYLETFGIKLREGRNFDAGAGAAETFPTEALVNQAFVDRFLGGKSPIGAQVKTYDGSLKTIIGVIGDTYQTGVTNGVYSEIFFPVRTVPMADLTLALKTSGDPMALAPTLRQVLHESFPDLPIHSIRNMDEVMRGPNRMRRFNLTLMNVFAGSALFLTAIGLYGVIAWIATQRRREIGVRQAFGANRGAIHALMLRSGLVMLLPGLALGLVGAWLLGRLLRSQLYGVGSANPIVFASASGLLLLIALAACLVPSRRALRVPPVEALRDD